MPRPPMQCQRSAHLDPVAISRDLVQKHQHSVYLDRHDSVAISRALKPWVVPESKFHGGEWKFGLQFIFYYCFRAAFFYYNKVLIFCLVPTFSKHFLPVSSQATNFVDAYRIFMIRNAFKSSHHGLSNAFWIIRIRYVSTTLVVSLQFEKKIFTKVGRSHFLKKCSPVLFRFNFNSWFLCSLFL